jgi:hypothetical protein
MDYQRNPKGVTIKTVDGQAISGKINLGINERLSDIFVRETRPFVILFDVTFDAGGRGKVLFINKDHIVWAEPEE